jgi:UDP-2,3-diacylglucosamine hydrolase
VYVIADIHLGFAPVEVERQLLGFLRALRSTGGSLLIAGDLFEFWYEWRRVIPRQGFRVLAALADLREAGVPVVMLGGNHDCWGGDFLREQVGVEYTLDAWRGSLAGWRSHVEHGDGLRPREDRRYRALRAVLRHPAAVRAFRFLHPDLAVRLASGSSHASRSYAARDGGRGLSEAAARAAATDRDLELIIYGHSHVAALERHGDAVYANPGSWLDRPTYLHVTPERIALRMWNGSTDGPDLDSLDHVAEKPLP